MGKTLLFIIFISLLCAGWRGVNGSRDYSYADCTYVKGESSNSYSGSRCFCYRPGTVIKWKDCWSTFKVNVTSSDNVLVVFPIETRNCQHPDNFLTVIYCFVEHYWPSPVQREKALDIPLVDEDVCFMTKSPRSNTEYTLHVTNKRLNRIRLLLFIFGLMLFWGAGSVCRSSLFFYTTGVSLGIMATFVFLILIFRNFVPKGGLFLVLLGAGSSLSYMGVQRVLNDWEDIVSEHWMELLGYVLISGLVSFAVCYKHGPITNKRTLTFMTLCMQAVGVVLLYHGITYPPAFYVLLAVVLSLKILPLVWSLLVGVCRLFCYLLFWRRRRPRIKLLTEEEYREQGERHTKACLEELREHCNKPGFPAWDTVLRLRSPQKFAEFLRSGCHVPLEELQNHESHYGPGGAYHEDMLFNSSSSDGLPQSIEEDNSDEEVRPNYSPMPNNLPGPSQNIPPACPYPPVNYSPQPEPMDAEDQDFF